MVYCNADDKKLYKETLERVAVDLDQIETHKNIEDLNNICSDNYYRLLLASEPMPAMRGRDYRSKNGIVQIITKQFANEREAE